MVGGVPPSNFTSEGSATTTCSTQWDGALSYPRQSTRPLSIHVTNFQNISDGIDIFNSSGTQVANFNTSITGQGDVSVFANGTLATNDQNNNAVEFWSQTGTLLQTVSLTGLTDPFGSTVGSDGILYIAGVTSNNIARVNSSGGLLGNISLSFSPGDLVMNPADGTLWISGIGNGKVEHVTTSGTVLGSFSTGLSGAFTVSG